MMKKGKTCLDMIMTVLLMFVMAFQVTEAKYHEWLGTIALIIFIVHNILNLRWYSSLAKGKYSLPRALRMIVNLGTLVAIVLAGYSGMVLSRHVFASIPIPGGIATARQMHLAATYWSFVLMGLHLGMHGNILAGKLKLQEKKEITWILRVVTSALAIYGAFTFGKAQIYRNMFLINQFAIFDYEIPNIIVILNHMAMFLLWCYISYYLLKGITFVTMKTTNKRAAVAVSLVLAIFMMMLPILFMEKKEETSTWGQSLNQENATQMAPTEEVQPTEQPEADSSKEQEINLEDGLILIKGGTFSMGSPESENWRVEDEVLHKVSVGDFYMSPYEVTGDLYEEVMGRNPSNFKGENLPVENVSWMDAITFCNVLSEKEGLKPAYSINGLSVSWDRAANGYRLPTEAEWEYACRAGTATPFNTEDSIGADRANFYGHYPYEIENNYFSQGNLDTKPGEYRQTTVAVDSFGANKFGLYKMHGNVSEWVWDYYGQYSTENANNPTGPTEGKLKVYRGGGWNDFAKNMRSAYRGTLEPDMASFNIGIRLVRNASAGEGLVVGNNMNQEADKSSKVLIAYFSWSGNTKGAAEEI